MKRYAANSNDRSGRSTLGAAAGKVILAGAGPGDPELITIKLQKALGEADVIIADRLVNPLIIQAHARPEAKLVPAGKQGYNDASLSQKEVSDLILKYALDGHIVLRLKGGDVAIFSNVLDELSALVEHTIPFEIIPGITAASGASAYAGIPLTARGYANGLKFFSFNPSVEIELSKWQELATTQDTLVLYMAVQQLPTFTKQLLEAGIDPALPLAVIEQATTIYQKVHVSTIDQCGHDFSGIVFSSPSLVIIGKVVSLHDPFKWFKVDGTGSVFNELAGERVSTSRKP